MAAPDDICLRGGVATFGAQLRRGELTSRDLTLAFLDRIDRLDPGLRSYARVMRDDALADAECADREIAAGLDRGALHGIPVAIKDLIDIADAPTLAGMPFRADHKATRDATIVARLRRAGAVILGKLSMTEGATILHHPHVPAPVNPWRAGHSSGFSSSGSGVAVAARLCVAALGSDTGGSVRIPSAFNGVTGVKTTWGRVSRDGVWPLVEALDTIGPMARSAADAAAMLGAIAGADPHDPTAAPAPVPDYRRALDEGIDGLTIGVDWDRIERECDPPVITALRHTADMLVAAGARLRAVTLPATHTAAFGAILTAGVADAHRETFPTHAASYGPGLAAMLASATELEARDVAAAMNAADRYTGQINALFEGIDLLLVPALPYPAPPAAVLEATLLAGGEAFERFFLYTLPFNISRHPTITFPAGFSDDGLPCAAQLVGAHFSESTLLRAAHRFQSMTDWHTRHPAIG
ncbi:amidase [Sphingomonas sp. MMSM20]|uniref:amidase n=1 Tax=Sphingomonas lycopersici TaxID=2951807 RepID=UPI002238AA77|nr:amidase [Sphingomonas lycopersici]MCW6531998.1 amidase [Sphingomonas lycopersici]